MRISAKGRYALAALTHMAQLHHNGEHITIIRISETLGISKIYLEQTFSLLKRAGVVNSVKGAQGGYRLANPPKKTTVFNALSAVETSLFEKTEESVADTLKALETAMHIKVFDPLDEVVKSNLEGITLYDLVVEVEKQRGDNNFMYYI